MTSIDENLKKVKLVLNIMKSKFLLLFVDELIFSGENFAFDVNTVVIKGKYNVALLPKHIY